MTKDAALDLALEALEESLYATTAKSQLLAFEALTAIKQARSAPVQKPVAWMHTMIDDVVIGHRPADLKIHPDRWMPLYKDPTPCQTCEALARTVMMDQTAHDTTPPAAQRQWVSLTDEELKAVTRLEGANSRAQLDLGKAFWAGARWAEAQLKEKNT